MDKIKLKRNFNSDNAKRKLDGVRKLGLLLVCGSASEDYSRWILHILEEKAKVGLEIPVSKILMESLKTNFDITTTILMCPTRRKRRIRSEYPYDKMRLVAYWNEKT